MGQGARARHVLRFQQLQRPTLPLSWRWLDVFYGSKPFLTAPNQDFRVNLSNGHYQAARYVELVPSRDVAFAELSR